MAHGSRPREGPGSGPVAALSLSNDRLNSPAQPHPLPFTWRASCTLHWAPHESSSYDQEGIFIRFFWQCSIFVHPLKMSSQTTCDETNDFSWFSTRIPYYVLWFSEIFIDVHRCIKMFMKFHGFRCISLDFQRVSLQTLLNTHSGGLALRVLSV